MASLAQLAVEVRKNDDAKKYAAGAAVGAAAGGAGYYAAQHPVGFARHKAVQALGVYDFATAPHPDNPGTDAWIKRTARRATNVSGSAGWKYRKMPKPRRPRLKGAAAGAVIGGGLVAAHQHLNKADTDAAKQYGTAAGVGGALGYAGHYTAQHPVGSIRSKASYVKSSAEMLRHLADGVVHPENANVAASKIVGSAFGRLKTAGASGWKYEDMPKPRRPRLKGAAAGAAAGVGLVALKRRSEQQKRQDRVSD